MLNKRMTFYKSWIIFLTDEELKEMKKMKKLLIIAPWTELDLSSDEKIRKEMRKE